jgi:hypothetical protein
MFFHLQYYYLINGVLKGGGPGELKFPNIRIITQGYDYPLPSFRKRFGINPFRWYIPFIRTFLGHGSWLKQPLQIRGINEAEAQRQILYSMIYLFNEMMIEMGAYFNSSEVDKKVFHIDSRDFVGAGGWTDELHPHPSRFLRIGQTFVDCIRQLQPPTYAHVFVVKKCNP